MEKLKIGLIIGSTRAGRFGEHVAPWVKGIAQTHKNLELEVLDLRDFPFPFIAEATSPAYMGGKYPNADVTRWAEKINSLDGFVVIVAEYNHGPTAVLKNAFDVLFNEWGNKPIAFVGYGNVGGSRAIEQLRQVVVEFAMAPIRNSVHIFAPWLLRETDGSLKVGALDSYADATNTMLTQLAWWAKALKAGRAQ